MEFVRKLTQSRPGLWGLIDSFTGRDEHTLEWFFHFAPGLSLNLDERLSVVTVLKDGHPFVKVNIPENILVTELRPSWYSSQYGVKEENQCLYVKWNGELDGRGIPFRWQLQLINGKTL